MTCRRASRTKAMRPPSGDHGGKWARPEVRRGTPGASGATTYKPDPCRLPVADDGLGTGEAEPADAAGRVAGAGAAPAVVDVAWITDDVVVGSSSASSKRSSLPLPPATTVCSAGRSSPP